MSELLGKETIDLLNTSENRGQSQSYGLNYQKTGKELMSLSEIAVMPGASVFCSFKDCTRFTATSTI